MPCAVRIEFAVIAELELENFRLVGCIGTLVSSLELHSFYSLSLSSNTTLVATLPMADCVPMLP